MADESIAQKDISGQYPAQVVLTLRDYFAAQALTGMLAYSHVNPMSGNYHENCTPENTAIAAYCYADAMLKARAK